MIQAAPPQARANRELYYAWLTSNGWPREVAWDEMVKEFGKPPTREEQLDAAAKSQQGAQLRQTGGAIAGTLGTSYLMANAPAWFASTPAIAPVLGEVVAGGGAAAAGSGAAAGGTAFAGGTAAGGTAAGGTAAAGGGLAGFGSVALPVAAAAAVASTIWEDGLKDIARGRGKRDDYANMAVDALTGTGLNMGLRLLGMPSVGRMLFGKGKGQSVRDGIRTGLKEAGVLDEQGQGTLSDGSLYNFGSDGKSMSTKEFNKIMAANPTAWGTASSLADTFAVGQGFSGKALGHAAGLYSKAAISNAGDDIAKVTANMKHFMKQQGMTAQSMMSQLDKGMAENQFSRSQYDIYANNIKNVFGAPEAPVEDSMALVRPEKGQVQRVSPGLYRDDTGKLRGSATMRGALEKAYGKTKAKA